MNSIFIIFELYLILLLQANISSKENFIHEKEEVTNLQEEYNSLLKWAKKYYSLNISSKIDLDENYFIAKEDISKGEILFDIPLNLSINLRSFFSFDNSNYQNLKKKYEKYLIKGKSSEQMLNDISYIEQSFMAFLLYKINIEKNESYEKFKEKYKYLEYLFKEDLSHLPSSFTNEQTKSFMNTTFYSFFNLMNEYLTQEIEILQNEIFNEKIDLDKYYKYRFIILQKSYNVSNTTTLIPFIDLIKHEFNSNKINAKLIVSKDNIKIKSLKDIKEDELLIIKQKKMTNQYSFLFYGKTYEELINYTPSFIIPIITSDILRDEGIELNIENDNEDNQIDLVWDKFYDMILPTYKEVMKLLNKDDSNYNCYKMFLKYLILIRDTIKNNKIEDLDEIFDDEEDVENIERIIKGEINFLDKKIKELENVIEKSKNKTLKVKKKNNDKDKIKNDEL